MKCKVFYVSPKGSAEQIASAIADAAKCAREALMPAYMPENLKLVFIGCEGNRADRVTLSFIAALNADRVANAALFACGRDAQALKQMRRALTERGVNVLDLTLTAPLKGWMGGGPKADDLDRARQFAQDCIDALAE